MTDWQADPGELYISAAAPDGVYLVRKDGVRFTEFLRLVDGQDTTVNVNTVAGEVSIDAGNSASFLVTRLPGGEPSLVFDTDGEVVYTEVLP